MYSNRAVRVIFRSAMQIRQRLRLNWAGRQKTALRKCVRMPGDGRRTIRTDITSKGKLSIRGE